LGGGQQIADPVEGRGPVMTASVSGEALSGVMLDNMP
jgi:hypothetical protein